MNFRDRCRPHWDCLTTGYLLLVGGSLFLWPNVVGIPTFPLRLTWAALSFPLLLFSAWALHEALRVTRPPKLPQLSPMGILLVLAACLAIAYPLFAFPLHAFSDEVNIALPSLTLFHRLARVAGWAAPASLTMTAILIGLYFCVRLPPRCAAGAVGIMAGVTVLAAWFLPQMSSLATRYPPLVHLIQFLSTVLGGGHLALLRMPNLIWTLLLALGIETFARTWTPASRYGAFLALLLGPLGWSYRTSLYQACGEITIGMCVVLLLSRILYEEREEDHASYLGALLSLWMIYRPTALLSLGLSLALLAAFRRRRALVTVSAIALPLALIWLTMYPTYRYPFLFQEQGLFPAASTSLLRPLVAAATALPKNLHLVGLIVLLGSSLVVWSRGAPAHARVLTIAWILGGVTSGVQQLIQEEVWYGYPRFNILLLLPLAVGVAGLLADAGPLRILRRTLGTLAVLALLAITPFDIATYAQTQRRIAEGIFQSPTGGDVPLPVTFVAEKYLREEPHHIILSPDYAFLDLYIAIGVLTPDDRTRIIRTSDRWSPLSETRPVLIQAPVVTTYQPNITAAQEDRLRVARAWGLQQPHHTIVRLGIEEVVVVP